MLAADPAFFQILSDTCTARGAAARLPDLIDAMDNLVCKDMSSFRAQQFGGLVAVELAPATLAAFHADLIGASPGGALLNDPVTKDLVYHVVNAVRKELGLSGAGATPGGAAAAPDTVNIYADAQYVHGLSVTNSDKAVFVTDARKDFVKYGHITEVPSVAKMKRLGVAGGVKRKLALEGSTDETATLSFDEAKSKAVTTMPEAKHMVRVLVYGLVAAYAIPVGKTVLGGRDKGWVTVPGEARQIRVGLSLQVGMQFLWSLTDSPLTDVRAFMRMVDYVMKEFIDEAATMTQHPDEVIETLIGTRKSLFRVDPGGGEDKAEAPAPAPAADKAAQRGTTQKGECMSWLTSGGCNDSECEFPHHENKRGLAHGRGGGRAQRAGGGGNRGGGAPQNWNYYQWYEAPPSKGQGRGKGKGKGRGGGGKGGAGGWGWGW